MQRYRITNTKSGADFGIYAGINEAAALDAMYRDAGYTNRASYIEEFSDDEHDASINYWRVDPIDDDGTVELIAEAKGRAFIIDLASVRVRITAGSDDLDEVTAYAEALDYGDVCLFSTMGAPSDVHADYLEWMRWAGWSFSKADGAMLRAALENVIERTMTV